jgi:hypothetical protein
VFGLTNAPPTGAHVAAEHNWRADRLSRRDLWGPGGTVRSVLDSFGEKYRQARVIALEGDPHVAGLLSLCRPAQSFGSEEQFRSMWRRAARASHALSDQPRPKPGGHPEGLAGVAAAAGSGSVGGGA